MEVTIKTVSLAKFQVLDPWYLQEYLIRHLSFNMLKTELSYVLKSVLHFCKW